jgi:acetyl-CoA acetyltransferase
MTVKRGTSSVAALVMARTMQRFAEKYPDHDPDMMADAIEFEKRALAAIKLHLPELPEVEKPATPTRGL